MRDNFQPTMEHVFQWEGGYVNHPKDPGGCTNYGITIGTYRAHVDPNATCDDLKAMPKHRAERIYRDEYWHKVKGDNLPAGTDLEVCDMAINAGPGTAARLLQKVVGTAQDGIIGPITIDAAWAMPGEILINGYHAERMRYYQSLSNWSTFGKGWTNRANAALEAALDLYSKKSPGPEEPDEEGSEQLNTIIEDYLKMTRYALIKKYHPGVLE